MLVQNLKQAWRNILRRRDVSIINILGLTTGIAVCILIFLYINHETSFDNFHSDVDNIYRVNLGMTNTSTAELELRATNHPATGLYLKNDFSQVDKFARMVNVSIFSGSSVLSCETSAGIKSFNEDHIFLADSGLLTMFELPFLTGDPKTALSRPNSIVLTERLARKYFGESDPIGKQMSLNGAPGNIVTGVLKELPTNTHLKISALLPTVNFSEGLNNAWVWPEFYTYIKLNPGTHVSSLKNELGPFVDRYLGEIMEDFGIEEKMFLQPVRDIHLDGNLLKEMSDNNSISTVKILSAIALLILVIAWINYLNLAISRSIERASEIGVRKVIGATRPNIAFQFLCEAFLINLIAIVGALIIVPLVTPYYNLVIGTGVETTGLWQLILQDYNWTILLGLLVLSTLFSGLYPGYVLSSFDPVLAIRGTMRKNRFGINLRQMLVVFQFSIGLLMISGTLIVGKQLNFMRGQEVGFNMDQLLVVKAPSIIDSTYARKVDLLREDVVGGVQAIQFCASSDIPGHIIQNNNSIKRREQLQEQSVFATYLAIDENFIPTYEFEVISGRNFMKDRQTDENSVILNENALKSLGYTDPEMVIGQTINILRDQNWRETKVVGVVKDFSHRSLAHKQEPFVFFNIPFIPYDYYSIKVSGSDLSQTIRRIEESYAKVFPENPFEYFFLDEYFDRQYKAGQRFGTVLGIFTCLAIFVACLGLLGLVTQVCNRRAKEASIRRVLGASSTQILLLLGQRFLLLIVIATLIATPIAWWGGKSWLQSFSYQTSLGISIFVIPFVIILIVSVGTIIWQSSKVLLVNPAEILRDD